MQSDMPRRLAPLWRRGLAAIIDLAILSLTGNLLAALYRPELIGLGQTGRIIGLMLVGIYLGGLNSFLTKGQSPGKKLTKLRVVDAGGEPLSRQLAFLRSMVLALPLMMQGLYIVTASPWVAMTLSGLLSVLSVGAAGALLYLYVFNRSSGQSLHDLLAGSFVVMAAARGPVTQRMWHGHLAVVVLWLLLPLSIGPALWWKWSGGSDWPEIFALQQQLQSRLQQSRVSVMRGEFAGSGAARTRYLQVGVVYPQRVEAFDAAANTVAAAVFESGGAAGIDELRVNVSYGFDILIASRYWSRSFVYAPQQWQQRLEETPQLPDTQARAEARLAAARSSRHQRPMSPVKIETDTDECTTTMRTSIRRRRV